jgi:hypothetical protein
MKKRKPHTDVVAVQSSIAAGVYSPLDFVAAPHTRYVTRIIVYPMFTVEPPNILHLPTYHQPYGTEYIELFGLGLVFQPQNNIAFQTGPSSGTK